MKYNGTDWVIVGAPGFSANAAGDIFLAIDGAGVPYVVYADALSTSSSGPATVMKFDGSNWVLVGSAGFSGFNVIRTSMTFDGSGTPYVAFLNTTNYFSSVMKFDGTNWTFVGRQDFAAPTYKYTPSIAMGEADTPYVAFTSNSYPFRSIAMKYNGISWLNVGDNSISAGEAHYTSLAFDKNKTPYVAYENWSKPECRATVRKLENSTWVDVGNTNFSEDTAREIHICIDNSNTPYVSYFSETTSKPTVMRLRSTIGIKEIGNQAAPSLAVSPNPNLGQFTITIPSAANENALVSVTDITGSQVAVFNAETNKATLVSLSLPEGIYLVNVRTQSVNLHERVIIQ